MMLTEGERLVVIASLEWAAMQHDKISRNFIEERKMDDATRAAHFSMECARLAEALKRL